MSIPSNTPMEKDKDMILHCHDCGVEIPYNLAKGTEHINHQHTVSRAKS